MDSDQIMLVDNDIMLNAARKNYNRFLVPTTDIKPATMLMYGKEASNRKQEINRQHHTIPNQRPKDKHYGNVHSQLYTFPRMPTMALL